MSSLTEEESLHPATSLAEQERGVRLQGSMTTFDIVFTVLAFNAPLSVFIGFLPIIIGVGNGLGAPTVYLGVGVLMAVFAVGFTTMGKHLPNPGAFYAYITAGLGKSLGLGAAFVAIASYVFIYVGGLAYGGLSLNTLVKDMLQGPDIPWWVYTLMLITVVAAFGYFRITLSARILTVTMILEVLVIVVWDAFTLAAGGAEGHSMAPLEPANILSGSVGLAVLYGILMFAGFEATAVFREEARRPEKTIPRATYITILVIAALYSVSTYCLIVGVGPSTVVEATATDPFGTALQAVGMYFGTVLQDVVLVLLCTSVFAANLASHNITARYVYSLSVDRVFPKFLSRVHPTHGSPHISSFVTSLVAVVFLVWLILSGADGATAYAWLTGIGGYTFILLLCMTTCAVLGYFWIKKIDGLSKWKTQIAPGLAALGLFAALIVATLNVSALVGGSDAIAGGLLAFFYGLLALGVVVAQIFRRTRPETFARIGRQEL